MDRTQHPSNNGVLGAPLGWDQQEMSCSALPITRVTIEGTPAMVSFWRPTAAELTQLNAGGTVALCVFGGIHPPVSVGVEP